MKIAITVLVVVVVAVGVWFVFSRQTSQPAVGTPTPKTNAPTPTSNTPASSQASVTIENFAFAPKDLVIARGTTVTWTNRDSVQHSIVSDTGYSAMNSPMLGKGAAFSVKFNTVGTYPYHCSPHTSMRATITVQ